MKILEELKAFFITEIVDDLCTQWKSPNSNYQRAMLLNLAGAALLGIFAAEVFAVFVVCLPIGLQMSESAAAMIDVIAGYVVYQTWEWLSKLHSKHGIAMRRLFTATAVIFGLGVIFLFLSSVIETGLNPDLRILPAILLMVLVTLASAVVFTASSSQILDGGQDAPRNMR